MNRQSFIDELRRGLTGKISVEEVNENVTYYEDYIVSQTRKGKTEDEVLEEIGDPRLIAKNICNVKKMKEEETNEQYQNIDDTKENQEEKKHGFWNFFVTHPKWAIAIIIVVIILFLILGIWLAISLLSFLWPIIIAVVIAFLGVKLIKMIRNN